ncbi:MAG TPA: lipoprotein insertase outer membrane protein LolB [Steroidobacteraceae bacterium]|nr:lipoprotein insertase outer membrane protein LolB [Steroidobacteraceae bacterium]
MTRRIAAAAVLVLASGCATLPPAPETADWPTRRAALQALPGWALNGRIAVAAGENGFSGGLEWAQDGERADIALSGPMGGARLRIRVDRETFSVTDDRGNTYSGEEAERFVAERIGPGEPLPVSQMRYWLVGAPAPGTPDEETLGDGERLASITQSGWQVRFDRYATVGEIALPDRLEMTTEGLRLRVVVSRWRLPP